MEDRNSMAERINIYAICPNCHTEFDTGLYAWNDNGANQIIDGLAASGTMTWVFDKTLGVRGRKKVPNKLRCCNCGTLVERSQLAQTARAAQANHPQ